MRSFFQILPVFLGLSKTTQKHFRLWPNPSTPAAKKFVAGIAPASIALESPRLSNRSAGSSRSNSASSLSDKGFITFLALTLLPLILTMGLALLATQYLTKNWIQSLHICRTELLKTQDQTSSHLQNLLRLNPQALALRTALRIAQAQYLAAAATNPPLAAALLVRIASLQRQRVILDRAQRALIMQANFQMSQGLLQVHQRLRDQNYNNQTRLPKFLRYSIQPMPWKPKTLAIHPDRPDIAPIYELNHNFQGDQSLSVSWRSQFAIHLSAETSWFKNQNQKIDGCSATLRMPSKNSFNRFEPVLSEDRL